MTKPNRIPITEIILQVAIYYDKWLPVWKWLDNLNENEA